MHFFAFYCIFVHIMPAAFICLHVYMFMRTRGGKPGGRAVSCQCCRFILSANYVASCLLVLVSVLLFFFVVVVFPCQIVTHLCHFLT